MMVFCKYQTWSAPVIIFILQFFFLLSISKVLKVPNDMDDFLTKVLIAFSKNLPIDKESGTKKTDLIENNEKTLAKRAPAHAPKREELEKRWKWVMSRNAQIDLGKV